MVDHGQCLLGITVVGTPMLSSKKPLRNFRGLKLLFNMLQTPPLGPTDEYVSSLSCGVVEAQPSQSPERA